MSDGADVSNTDDPAAGLGSASLTPADDVVAGTYVSWTITYTVGELGMDDHSALLIAIYQTSDMGRPQFEDPAAENYASVEVSGEAVAEARYDPDAHLRPWQNAVRIDLTDGSLAPGDEVTLTLGDRSGGSLGVRAQSYVERDFGFRVLTDPHGTGDFVEVPDTLTFDVVPGRARSLAAVAPSTIAVDEDATVSVRAEDYFANLATGYEGTVVIEDENGTDVECHLENGVGHATVPIGDAGVHRLSVQERSGDLATVTNPIRCGDHERRTYWGDMHGQSGETVGTGTVREYFEYAAEASFVDFASHAGNDFQIDEALWETITDTVRDFHEPGEFVTFPCYEWSANSSIGGDHNVYFREHPDLDELEQSSTWLVNEGPNKLEGLHPVEALYDHYSGRDDVLVIPHQGGRPADRLTIDPDLTPFVEITSVWGVFEGFGHEALASGHPIGFVGGSDDHTGRPGVAPPDNLEKHNMTGGLQATRAEELTRDALWEAFEDRSCYATTGERILLDVGINDATIGERVTVEGSPTVTASVNATAPIRSVDLFRGDERIATQFLTEGSDRIELCWTGSRGRVRDKVLEWTGGLSLDQGEITEVEQFGFDHPEDGVKQVTDTAVHWEARTSGNYQGLRLDVDAPDSTELSIGTEPASTTVELGWLGEPHRVPADGVGAALEVRPIGTASKLDADVSFQDDDVEQGTHPYYVRVRQMDGEMAWSSPIYVEVE